MNKNWWKRFLRNGLAVSGLLFISITLLAGGLAYMLAPDPVKDAHSLQPALALKDPGFQIVFYYPEERQARSFSGLFLGEEATEKIPLQAYFREANRLKGLRFNGTDMPSDTLLLHASADAEWEAAHLKEFRFLLGTDRFGRDMLSRLLVGARVSLMVGLLAVVISLFIGVTLGAVAGYFKGWTDSAVSWLINVVWSLPTLLVVAALTVTLGKGIFQVFIAVGLTMWVDVARMVRGQVLSLREKEYIEVTRVMGFSSFRIIFYHILPNIISPLLVIAAANFAAAILLEAGLSFLGFGVQAPAPSWGSMIREHYGYIVLNKAYLALVPGIAILFLVMAFNFVANGLRDAFDVRLR